MRDSERKALEYRPQINWQIDLLSVVKASGATPGQVETYRVPSQIQAAIDYPASQALDSATQLLSKVDRLSQDISNCLTGNASPHGITFEQYKKALAEQDWAIVDLYEGFNNDNLYGRAQVDVFSALYDIQNEFSNYRDFINNTFLDGAAKYDNLAAASLQEQAQLEAIVARDIKDPGTQDLTPLAIKASICKAALDRIANANKFVGDLEASLTLSLQDHYDGRALELVTNLASIPHDTLEQVVKVNELTFSKAVQGVNDAKRKMKRLSDPQMLKQMDAALAGLSMAKIETSQKILLWAKDQDFDDESQPIVRFMDDVVATMQEVESAYDSSIVDAYKFNRLDKMQKDDYIRKLREKKKARQVYWLTRNMVDGFNFGDANRERQIQRFVQNNNLLAPATLCSGDGSPAMTPAVAQAVRASLALDPTETPTVPATPTPQAPTTGGGLGEGLVESIHIKDGTIMNVDINKNAQIDASKINTEDATNLVSSITANPGLTASNEGVGAVVISLDQDYLYDVFDDRYYTKLQLGSMTAGSSGASLIGLSKVDGLSETIRDVQSAINTIVGMVNSGAKKFVADIGDGTATEFVLQHNFSAMDISITVRENETPYEIVLPDIYVVDENTVKLLFGEPPLFEEYRVIVIG